MAEDKEKTPKETSAQNNLMKNIQRNYMSSLEERKALVTLYIPEIDDYVTQEMYMSDVKPTIYGTYGGIVRYNAVRIAFIGY